MDTQQSQEQEQARVKIGIPDEFVTPLLGAIGK